MQTAQNCLLTVLSVIEMIGSNAVRDASLMKKPLGDWNTGAHVFLLTGNAGIVSWWRGLRGALQIETAC
jgi:hypothetical protein